MTDKKKEESPVSNSSQDPKGKEKVTQNHIVELLRERKAKMDEVTLSYDQAYHSLTEDFLKDLVPDVLAGTVYELKEEFIKDKKRNVLNDKIWFNYARVIYFSNLDGTIDDTLIVMVHGWFMDGVNCIKWDKRGMSVDEFKKRYIKAEDQTYIKAEDIEKDE